MKQKKQAKLLSLLLALGMAVEFVPTEVFAATDSGKSEIDPVLDTDSTPECFDLHVSTYLAQTPLSFNKISAYDVPKSNQDVAIIPINLSGGIEGGLAPYTFSKIAGPDWLSVSAEGIVTGTPRNEDITGFGQTMQVRVDDNNGEFVTFVLNVGKITPATPDNPIVTQIVGTATGLNLKAGDKLAYGNNPGKPQFTITSEGARYSASSAFPYWMKWDGTQWVKLEDDAIAEPGGKYKYHIDCLNAKPGYIFGDTVTVSINGNTDGTVYRAYDKYVYWTSPVINVPVATPANYTVKHMQEKLDAPGTYEEVTADTQTLTGYVGENTAAVAKEYPGFVPQTITQTKIANDGSTIVEIKYDRKQIIFRFHANGGEGVMSDMPLAFGETKRFPPNTFTREGYTFSSWNRKADGSGAKNNDQQLQEYTSGKLENNLVIDFYAQWKKDTESHTHTQTLVTGKKPTCTDDGWKDYYKCDCGKYFEDEKGTKEIKNLAEWKKGDGKLEKLGHTLFPIKGNPATCQNEGLKSYLECDVCGKAFDQKTKEEITNLAEWRKIPKLEHDLVKIDRVEPTKDSEGIKEYYQCKMCKKYFTDNQGKNEIDDLEVWKKGEGKLEKLSAYQIIEGMNGKWNKGSKSGLTFKSNGEFEELVGVTVDGIMIDKKDYTAKDGSTIVTLKPEYLETLKVGKHTFDMVYQNEMCGTSFEITNVVNPKPDVKPVYPKPDVKPSKPNSKVPTSVATDVQAWFNLAGMSAVLASLLSFKKRNKK